MKISSTTLTLVCFAITCLAVLLHSSQYLSSTPQLALVVGIARFAAAFGAFVGLFVVLWILRKTVLKRLSLSASIATSAVVMMLIAVTMGLMSMGNEVSAGLLQLYSM